MITKILSPSSSGKIVYDNKGSAGRLMNYLEHEARENKKDCKFFNQFTDDFLNEQVQKHIDNNVKGLKKDDAKFYSIVISPSEEELKHIGNDRDKLKEYTRSVMKNYAENFNLNKEKQLDKNDIVWYATFHESRKYGGSDKEVKEGRAKSGETKKGEQTHVHIIVSRRDKDQKISLTPNGSKSRFNIKQWQKKNAADFQQQFSYTKQCHYQNTDKNEKRLKDRLEGYFNQKEGKQVEGVNQKYGLNKQYFDTEKVIEVARGRGFDRQFYRNLKNLEESFKKGINPEDPYHHLAQDYRKKPSRNYKEEYLINRISHIQIKHGFDDRDLNIKAVLEIGKERNYDKNFYKDLRQLEERINKEGRVPENYQNKLKDESTKVSAIKILSHENSPKQAVLAQQKDKSMNGKMDFEKGKSVESKALNVGQSNSLNAIASVFSKFAQTASMPSEFSRDNPYKNIVKKKKKQGRSQNKNY